MGSLLWMREGELWILVLMGGSWMMGGGPCLRRLLHLNVRLSISLTYADLTSLHGFIYIDLPWLIAFAISNFHSLDRPFPRLGLRDHPCWNFPRPVPPGFAVSWRHRPYSEMFRQVNQAGASTHYTHFFCYSFLPYLHSCHSLSPPRQKTRHQPALSSSI